MVRNGLAVALGLIISGLAQSVLGQIGDIEESSQRRRALAEAWAPIFFHDEAPEFLSSSTGFSPVDTPVSFYFDGNQDVRDNGLSSFRLNQDHELQALSDVPLYFSVIESRSHIYLNYFFYHALDGKEMGHVHDTENIWIVVEKNESPLGRLEMVIANAHGFPMIYGPSLSEEAIWRTRITDSVAAQFLPAIDRFSSEHHDVDRPEFWPDNDSQHFVGFIARLGHGHYKWNRSAWEQGEARGSVYVPRNCLSCRSGLGPVDETTAVRSVDLVDFDEFLTEVLASNHPEAFFVPETRSSISARFSKDRSLPTRLAAGTYEREGRINLFYSQMFKTGFRLSDPARVHLFFDPENSGVSSVYLYNFYLKPGGGTLMAAARSSKRPPLNFNRASLLFFVERMFD